MVYLDDFSNLSFVGVFLKKSGPILYNKLLFCHTSRMLKETEKLANIVISYSFRLQ